MQGRTGHIGKRAPKSDGSWNGDRDQKLEGKKIETPKVYTKWGCIFSWTATAGWMTVKSSQVKSGQSSSRGTKTKSRGQRYIHYARTLGNMNWQPWYLNNEQMTIIIYYLSVKIKWADSLRKGAMWKNKKNQKKRRWSNEIHSYSQCGDRTVWKYLNTTIQVTFQPFLQLGFRWNYPLGMDRWVCTDTVWILYWRLFLVLVRFNLYSVLCIL